MRLSFLRKQFASAILQVNRNHPRCLVGNQDKLIFSRTQFSTPQHAILIGGVIFSMQDDGFKALRTDQAQIKVSGVDPLNNNIDTDFGRLMSA